MITKSIRWLKEHWMYLTASIFAIEMLWLIIGDKCYYFNRVNTRYTIGKYHDRIYIIGPSSGMSYGFTYIVNGKEYTTSSSGDFSHIVGLPIIIKYSMVDPGRGEPIEVVVPSWVLSPPKDGWKEYPPDINWEGAVLDTLYMQKLREEIN
ncbi:MAG: hypothetical protein LBN24_12285 [Mediterranea sp.]|jgi:hypothetical protein|nr:hypothetical protein [Mediterranea sp.]